MLRCVCVCVFCELAPSVFPLFRVARHQPEVNLLSQQWAEFYTHYQSFHQWLLNMDTEMANLNPFISNMATVQMQLVKLKVINFPHVNINLVVTTVQSSFKLFFAHNKPALNNT